MDDAPAPAKGNRQQARGAEEKQTKKRRARETAKNVIKKVDGKRRQGKSFFSLNFFGQKFLTWTSPKQFFVVFLNPPC
jgi:hypothetical protein